MKKIFFAFILCTSAGFVLAQDTLYYNDKDSLVGIAGDWSYMDIVSETSGQDGPVYLVTRYTSGGLKIKEAHYSDEELNYREGTYILYYPDGTPKLKAMYTADKVDGLFETFFENGQLKRSDAYDHGSFITGTCYNIKGKKIKYYPYASTPHFKACKIYMNNDKEMEDCFYRMFFLFLDNNLVYPAYARENGIEGQVIVKFAIQKDGTAGNVFVTQSIHYQLDEAAMNVIKKLPPLVPAKLDGDPVEFYYSIPINFKLN